MNNKIPIRKWPAHIRQFPQLGGGGCSLAHCYLSSCVPNPNWMAMKVGHVETYMSNNLHDFMGNNYVKG